MEREMKTVIITPNVIVTAAITSPAVRKDKEFKSRSCVAGVVIACCTVYHCLSRRSGNYVVIKNT